LNENNTPKSSLLARIAPLILSALGILGIGLAFWSEIRDDPKLGIIFSTLVLFILTERISSFIEGEKKHTTTINHSLLLESSNNTVIQKFEEIRNGLQQSGTVYATLTPTEVFEKLLHSPIKPSIIKDTIFRYDSDLTYIRDKGTYERSHEWFREAIRDGCQWYDLVTENMVDARRRHIEYGRTQASYPGQYNFRIVPNYIPMLNCIVVKFTDKSREVYFGWDYDTHRNGLVFASRATHVVDYFERLFDQQFSSGMIPTVP